MTKYVDITPTWTGCIPLLIAGIRDGTDKGREAARLAMLDMAKAADLWNREVSSMTEALKAAERFIVGFEDDETQEGIAELLASIRRFTSTALDEEVEAHIAKTTASVEAVDRDAQVPTWGEHMQPGERQMAEALVEQIIERGYCITVHDGGGVTEARLTTDKQAILKAMGSTGEDMLFVWSISDSGRKQVGQFYLVYGNSGDELIADHSSNDLCDGIWNALEPLMNQLEAERDEEPEPLGPSSLSSNVGIVYNEASGKRR